MVRNQKKIDKCNSKASTTKSAVATGFAIGAAIGAAALLATTGPAAIGLIALSSVALKSSVDLIPNSAVCGGKPTDPVLATLGDIKKAVTEINTKLDAMKNQIAGLTHGVNKLEFFVRYSRYTNKIIDVMHLYNNVLQFSMDQNGLMKDFDVDSTASASAEAFVTAALDEGPRLTTCMDRLSGMINGEAGFKSMFQQAPYFCNPQVRQYYNMLIVQGYDLLFKAFAMRGIHLDSKGNIDQVFINEERDRLIRSIELGNQQCGEFLSFSYFGIFQLFSISVQLDAQNEHLYHL